MSPLKHTIFIIYLLTIASTSTFSIDKKAIKQVDSLFLKASTIASHKTDSLLLISATMYKLSEDALYEYGTIEAHIIKSICFMNKMKIDSAIYILEASDRFLSENPEYLKNLSHGKVKLYLSNCYMRKSKVMESKAYILEAMGIFETLGDKRYLAKAYSQNALLETNMNNVEESVNYLLKSLNTLKESGLEEKYIAEDLARDYLSLSVNLHTLLQYENALEYAHKSLSLYQALDNKHNIIQSLIIKGHIQRSLELYDSAFHHFEDAKKIASVVNIPYQIYICEFAMANIYTDTKQYLKSNQHLYNLMGNAYYSNPHFLKEIYYVLAQNHYYTSNLDSAILYAKMAQENALKSNDKNLLANILGITYRSYEQKNEIDSAYHYYKEYSVTRDSVYQKASEKKLTNLYAQLQTLDKQYEIEKLKKDGIIQNAQNRLLIFFIIGSVIIAVLVALSIYLFWRNKQRKLKLHSIELEVELEKKYHDVHLQVVKIINLNNALSDIEENLKKIDLSKLNGDSKYVNHIRNTIKMNQTIEKEWNSFDKNFGSVHTAFISKITSLYPNLTVNEKRLAALLKLNLGNKEIADILNIEGHSAKMAKYRLKRKLNIQDSVDLYSFLQTIDSN